MLYFTSDIHNNCKKFRELLKVISLSGGDRIYVLGDLYDRNDYNPDPVGVYFTILELKTRCTVVRGNHDTELATYIMNYYGTPEKKRSKLEPYPYNSFELLKQRLTPVDMMNMAKLIMSWPLQVSLEWNGSKYLLAHAMTSNPEVTMPDDYYLTGVLNDKEYLERGIEGYISICGHRNIGGNRIWKNSRGNVYLCDCGCGYRDTKLGCLCLDTKEEYYA